MIDDHQAALRRQHQALGRDRAMRHVARIVQHRNRGQQFAHDLQRGIDVDPQRRVRGQVEQLRQPRARHRVIGDDDVLGRVGQTLGAAEADVADMTKIDQTADAFAHRRFQSRKVRAKL